LAQRASSKVRLEILPPAENQWQIVELRHINTAATGAGIALLASRRWGKRAKR